MTLLLDTSVVIASLDADEPHHEACDRLLSLGGHGGEWRQGNQDGASGDDHAHVGPPRVWLRSSLPFRLAAFPANDHGQMQTRRTRTNEL
jgi:hypothetical protein